MGVGQVSVAAATAVVGFDLFSDEWFQQLSEDRELTAIGVAGSAAALDSMVELFVGTEKIGEFYNSAVGMVLMDAHMVPIDADVDEGELLHLYVIDAPLTNPINVVLTWE